jgi:hypothetical protein
MNDCTELIKSLREEAEWAEANEWETPIMLSDHLKQAADAIEELTAFAHYVAKEAFDEYEALSYSAFFELVCRKLYKLGIVEKDGKYWSYEPPKEEN